MKRNLLIAAAAAAAMSVGTLGALAHGGATGVVKERMDLAAMPPDAVFMHLADTCSSCHQDFRKEKQ